MANVSHSALTSNNLHEPKGADSADVGQVYVSDGSGSGTWSFKEYTLSATIADISTASTIYVPVPYAGTVLKVNTVLTGAIATADSVLTVKNSAGSSMGTITVAYTSSAAGDCDSLTPASNNTVTAGSFITVETDGASTNTIPVVITVVLSKET